MYRLVSAISEAGWGPTSTAGVSAESAGSAALWVSAIGNVVFASSTCSAHRTPTVQHGTTRGSFNIDRIMIVARYGVLAVCTNVSVLASMHVIVKRLQDARGALTTGRQHEKAALTACSTRNGAPSLPCPRRQRREGNVSGPLPKPVAVLPGAAPRPPPAPAVPAARSGLPPLWTPGWNTLQVRYTTFSTSCRFSAHRNAASVAHAQHMSCKSRHTGRQATSSSITHCHRGCGATFSNLAA